MNWFAHRRRRVELMKARYTVLRQVVLGVMTRLKSLRGKGPHGAPRVKSWVTRCDVARVGQHRLRAQLRRMSARRRRRVLRVLAWQ